MNIKKAKEKHEKEIFDKAGVIGIGIGIKEKNKKSTGEKAITVFVEKKKPEKELKKRDIVQKRIEGHKTDVIETGKIKAELNRKKIHRPFPMGVSVGGDGVTAGTAGFIAFKDKEAGGFKYPEAVVVTNRHVIGQNEIGSPIYQPGLFDSDKKLKVGEIADFVPLRKRGNIVDAGCFRLDGRKASSYIHEIGVPEEIIRVSPGDMCCKFGRTTGLKKGKVKSVNVSVVVRYGSLDRHFRRQIITEDISAGGDSGSAGIRNGKLFGLLFAGSSAVTVFNPIEKVLELLKLRLIL